MLQTRTFDTAGAAQWGAKRRRFPAEAVRGTEGEGGDSAGGAMRGSEGIKGKREKKAYHAKGTPSSATDEEVDHDVEFLEDAPTTTGGDHGMWEIHPMELPTWRVKVAAGHQ